MRGAAGFRWLVLWVAVGMSPAPVSAETIELVTYYPSSTSTGDLHTTSLTVGTAYNGVTPNDGEAFIQSLLSVGSTAPANIAGGWGAPQLTKLWLQDNTAGAYPALVIAGGTAASGGGAVQFVDTANTPVGDFGVSNAGAASEVGIAARRNNTGISFYTTPAGLPILRMVIQPPGNIGIGTPNPASRLHIKANSAGGAPWIGQLFIEPADDNQDASISLRTTSGADRIWTLMTGAGGGSTNFRIFDSTAGLDRLNIDATGNVGIGTTGPQMKLDVAQNNAIRVGDAYLSSGGPQYAHFASNAWYDGSANWQIPDAARASGLLQFVDNGIYFYQRAAGAGANAWGPVMVILPSGNVIIPKHLPDLNDLPAWSSGGLRVWDLIADGGGVYVGLPPNLVIQLKSNGLALKPGGGAWGDSSDLRLKKNVAPLKGALERVLALRGVEFEWKDPASHGNYAGRQIGMIGQEVEKVFPEWVSMDKDGMRLVSVRGFEALTVEAMREQQREIEKLKAENNGLKQRMEKLESTSSGR